MDSVVLLHLLHTLATRFGWRLSALHVHHGISSNADAWADFCTGLCARNDIPLHIERVNIDLLRADHGIEAAARKLRQASFAAQDCDFVALAHHADDQVELFFLRLLRGAGGAGLAGMKWRSPSPADKQISLIRPLLDFSKAELLDFARESKIRFRDDATNFSSDILRNRIRHDLLPRLRNQNLSENVFGHFLLIFESVF